MEKYLAYFHDDYLGWWNRDPLPADKAEVKKLLELDCATTKVLRYSVKPVGTKIHGNVAFAHYYWRRLMKDAEGKEKLKRGRWTDILMKVNGKWLLIGDHGGPDNGEEE